jgi:hypothetical protein
VTELLLEKEETEKRGEAGLRGGGRGRRWWPAVVEQSQESKESGCGCVLGRPAAPVPLCALCALCVRLCEAVLRRLRSAQSIKPRLGQHTTYSIQLTGRIHEAQPGTQSTAARGQALGLPRPGRLKLKLEY